MFRNLLRPDSPLMITMTQLTDCIFLSLFFILGCFPVVTAGASFAALYDSAFRAFREGERHSWQRFLAVYKANWKQSIAPGVVIGLLSGLLLKGMIGVWNAAVYAQISWMVFSGAAVLAVVAVGILSLAFPMLSRFDNPVGVLLRNTLFLGLANLPRTMALGIVNTLSFYICLRWIFPLFFLPALAALIGSLFIEPIFKPYM